MDKLLEHIHFLTKKFPHRGSTTQSEKEAAHYISTQLTNVGYDAVTQKFFSATSAYYPPLLFGVLTAISIIVYRLFPIFSVGIVAIVLIILGLISVLLDSAFRDNPLNLILPKQESQNVIAKLPAAKNEKNNLVIMAHIDSHRTPLLFSSPFWVNVLKLIIPVGVAASLITCIAILFSIFYKNIFEINLIFDGVLLFFLILIILMAQADLTKYTTGANDNASGAATLLVLAEELKKQPFAYTSVYFVASGCEEVGSYGARAFIAEYEPKVGSCYWLTIDGLAAQKALPGVICSEKFFLEVKSDPTMLKIANAVIKENPETGAFLLPLYQGAYTDSSPAGLQGFKVLSLLALRKDGVLPAWHTLRDNFESVDKTTLSKCLLFIHKFIDVYRREIG